MPCHPLIFLFFIRCSFLKKLVAHYGICSLVSFTVSDIAGKLQLRVSGHPEALCWLVLTVWQVIDQTRRITHVPVNKG